jgi:sporulation protein YlmC with PRC-barrel domain
MFFLMLFMLHEAGAQLASDARRVDMHIPERGVAKAQSGKDIGSVIDFIVDLSTGRILFAAVAPPAARSKDTAVVLLPWSLAEVDSSGSVFNFRVTAEVVRAAPRLSEERWKQPPSQHWLSGADKYWHPYLRKISHFPSHSALVPGKATALIDVPVHGTGNSVLGTIRQLVFDPADGAIALVVLAREAETLQAQDHIEFLSLSWDDLYVGPSGDRLVAVVGQKVLT